LCLNLYFVAVGKLLGRFLAMIVLFFLLIFSIPLHLSASKFWPIPVVLKHEFVGTKQGCLKGILKRIDQFLIIQGDK
jgi:hypothetical protein